MWKITSVTQHLSNPCDQSCNLQYSWSSDVKKTVWEIITVDDSLITISLSNILTMWDMSVFIKLNVFLLFCSTPNEKLLGRLVKEKVCFQMWFTHWMSKLWMWHDPTMDHVAFMYEGQIKTRVIFKSSKKPFWILELQNLYIWAVSLLQTTSFSKSCFML